MLDLVMMADVLDTRIYDAVLVLKKRRQVPTTDVAVFVDSGCENGAAVLLIPSWIVGTSPKEGNAKGSANYNQF